MLILKIISYWLTFQQLALSIFAFSRLEIQYGLTYFFTSLIFIPLFNVYKKQIQKKLQIISIILYEYFFCLFVIQDFFKEFFDINNIFLKLIFFFSLLCLILAILSTFCLFKKWSIHNEN